MVFFSKKRLKNLRPEKSLAQLQPMAYRVVIKQTVHSLNSFIYKGISEVEFSLTVSWAFAADKQEKIMANTIKFSIKWFRQK